MSIGETEPPPKNGASISGFLFSYYPSSPLGWFRYQVRCPSNLTPHPDAREASRLDRPLRARAGERERYAAEGGENA